MVSQIPSWVLGHLGILWYLRSSCSGDPVCPLQPFLESHTNLRILTPEFLVFVIGFLLSMSIAVRPMYTFTSFQHIVFHITFFSSFNQTVKSIQSTSTITVISRDVRSS